MNSSANAMEGPISPLTTIPPDSSGLHCDLEVAPEDSTLVPVESLQDTSQTPNSQHRGSNAQSSLALNQTRQNSNTFPLSTHNEVSSQNNDRGPTLGTVEMPNPDTEPSALPAGSIWWKQKPMSARWILTLVLLAVAFLGLIIVIAFYAKFHHRNTQTTETLVESLQQPDLAFPVADGSLGATVLALATYFTAEGDPKSAQTTKLVYNAGNGTICVRTKSGEDWLNNVQCVFGANPKPNTPVTILDWLGGPSIYFITIDNFLSGIDNVPSNDTWKLSILAMENTPTHPLSQLASVTWLNGTSAWLYYTDINSQLREYGIDDYRDESWRNGSTGPLGLTQTGSGIGCSRYLIDGGEVLEVFIQATNAAIHGRVYINSVWTSDFYAVDGTSETIMGGASLTATTVTQPSGIFVFLAYVASNSFLTVQSRGILNVTQYNAFSVPVNVIQGDGESETGLGAVGVEGAPKIYFGTGQKILELSGSAVTATNWTQVDVTSL
jgi:hypothetical protein